ncbi:Protein cms1 [Microbotryomycetes sp. JL221]|nr:Protein cms1 [Microbotryomycetes sp. JL221]
MPSGTKPAQISGDALEDDFALDDSFVASSPEATTRQLDDDSTAKVIDPTEEDEFAPGSDDEDDEDRQQPARKKLKRDTTKTNSKDDATSAAKKGQTASSSKRDKLKQKKQQKKLKLQELGVDEREQVGLLPPEIIADRLADKQAKALPKLSAIELTDLRIPQSFIQDTSHVNERDNLEQFIRKALPTMPSTLAKVPKAEGAPRILVIAGAALRVADLCREAKPFKTKEIDVGKLFAKHFKLSEHVEYLKSTKLGIAVGTPNRIGKLLSETESIKLLHLSHIVIDATHLDSKRLSLLDMPESKDLFELVLGNKLVMQRFRDDKLKLVLF